MTKSSATEPTLLSAVWRFRILVFGAVLVGLAIGFAYALTLPGFSATASLVLENPQSAPVFATPTNQAADRYIGDQITVLKSPELATAASQAAAKQNPPLNLSADYFRAHTAISGSPTNGNLVQITFTASNGPNALAGLNAIEAGYEQTVRDAVQGQLATILAPIDAQLASINKQLTSLSAQLAAGPTDQAALRQEQQSLLTRAQTLSQKRDQVVVDSSSGSNGVALSLGPETPTHNSRLLIALPILAVAGLLGLMIAVVTAYALAYRRPVFRKREEPEELLGAPLIAEIPRFDRSRPLPAADPSATRSASAFRRAALGLQTRATPEEDGATAGTTSRPVSARNLVVVSAARQEGRSTVVANLGLALAGNGLNVLLVDADPSRSGLTRLLRSNLNHVPVRGLPNFAPTSMSLEGFTGPHQLGGRLTLLRFGQMPVGAGSAANDAILHHFEPAFNMVLIDTPPLTEVGPLWQVVRWAAGALVVVDHNASVASVDEVARLLIEIEMPTRGYIYNHRPRLRRQEAKEAEVPQPTPAVAVGRFRRPPGAPATRPPEAPGQQSGGFRRAR